MGINVDLCLFNLDSTELVVNKSTEINVQSILALSELKGGIDPAGADEHWKTAQASLNRIRQALYQVGYSPDIFFGNLAATRKWDAQ
ncbi:MAG: type II site-specific deoxyribonuclease [Arthrospira sp. SH-MAG29]|nr:AvaI/BsoBI family type II restriction endonuclease [Arthrospira sp. SH-MAG29]MBS0015962.1 type II site-specific deoxyribonuclease [Arthrospira sp. SH-MAG29]